MDQIEAVASETFVSSGFSVMSVPINLNLQLPLSGMPKTFDHLPYPGSRKFETDFSFGLSVIRAWVFLRF